MPPKRARPAAASKAGIKTARLVPVSSGFTRSPAVFVFPIQRTVSSQVYSDSEPEAPRSSKMALALKDLPDLDDSDDEPLVRRMKSQQPRPKPARRGVPTTSASGTKAASAKPQPQQQQPQQQQQQQQQQSAVLKSKRGKGSTMENQENASVELSKASKISAVTAKDDGKSGKKNPRTASSMTPEQLAAAYEDLSAKYKHLKQLRVTEAERLLDEYRAKLEEATQSAENYRAQMEPQLESALRNQEKLRDKAEILNAQVRTLQRQLRDCEEKFRQQYEQEQKAKAKNSALKSTSALEDTTPSGPANSIKELEDRTCFKFVPRDAHPRSNKEKRPNVWDCENIGYHGTLRFSLTYDLTCDKVTYTPRIEEKRDAKLLRHLPDYLTEEIEFQSQFESKLFENMLAFNNKKDS
ncbi:hypothetical protein BGZ70_003151 [Mortierella alpina]|uniref:Monopolin complex subunit Csm1/Pcs1 C-terminal domain-containing protein n=1 Tax=Mortierella alpina TaxID=64518 RepID=A0A9P6JAN2_MORAP|nr:hypothetical protein BGZ70_003151 [Mortierella alpina]